MKLLFWSFLILAAMWLIAKKKLGGGNDLTAHFQEQNALQNIGDVAVQSNLIGSGNFPIATMGQNPLAGINIDPLNPSNPFTQPFVPSFNVPQPNNNDTVPFFLF